VGGIKIWQDFYFLTPGLSTSVPVLSVCLDMTMEVVPELSVCLDTTTEVVPELSVCSDTTTETTEVVPELSVCECNKQSVRALCTRI